MNEFEKDLLGQATAQQALAKEIGLIRSIPRHRSANLIVDIADTAEYFGSLSVISGASQVVGGIVDLVNGNTYCNVYVAGQGSGILQIAIQTSDSLTSGSFTDPTSGLVTGEFPVNVASGGLFYANSGLPGSGNFSPAAPVSGAPAFCSGGIAFAAFQRPHRYARLLCLSGTLAIQGVPFQAGFISQKKTTGSGGGYSLQPQSGGTGINV